MSTYTNEIGLQIIADGDLVDTWGQAVDTNFTRTSEAAKGVLNVTVSGSRTLVNATDSTDETHFANLLLSGTGGTVVLPTKPGQYIVRNGCTSDVTIKNAAVTPLANAILHANTTTLVLNDGVASVYQLGFGGNMKDYIDGQLTQAKAYTDAASFAGLSASFPAQGGNAGKYLMTNGTNPAWGQPTITDVTGLQAQLNNMSNVALAYFAYNKGVK